MNGTDGERIGRGGVATWILGSTTVQPFGLPVGFRFADPG